METFPASVPAALAGELGRGLAQGCPPLSAIRNHKPLAHKPAHLLALPTMATNPPAIKRLGQAQHTCTPSTYGSLISKAGQFDGHVSNADAFADPSMEGTVYAA